MMDFASAWDGIALGDALTVSNGAIEPLSGPDSIDHRAWRSHNFGGVLSEKIDGSPRQMRVDLPADSGGNVIGYLIREGEGHSFTPAVLTPAQARDQRWEEAKAYRDLRQTEMLPLAGIVEGDIVVAQRDAKGQAWIDRFGTAAGVAKAIGAPLEITFTDGANRPFTIDRDQILQIWQASLTQQSLCQGASQAVRAALNAATTVEEINAVDITAGYPPVGA